MAKLTYGETIFLKRESLDFTLSIDKMVYSFHRRIPPRMSYEKAMTYYKNELNKVWENMK